MELMGHSSITVSQKYVHASAEPESPQPPTHKGGGTQKSSN